MRARILTLGHSTRSLAQLLALLEEHGVALLADVRKLRGSRAFPHFDEAKLERSLRRAGIVYAAFPALAGRRGRAETPSDRPCWRNRSFQNYADHMRTAEFRDGVRALLAAARGVRVALMCAEAVPWRCHRALIADWLVVRARRRVDDIVGLRLQPHRLTPCARVVNAELRYDLP